MLLLLLRVGRDDHRRRDDHGSRLLVLHLRELHLERPERRRRGIRHRRRHPDVRPERRRDVHPDDQLRERGVPNVSASHLDSGGEASSRDSDGDRPDLELGVVHPGREPDGFRPAERPDEVHLDREPDVRCHLGEEHPVPDEEPDVPQVRTNTGCYRREAPSGLASDLVLLASVLPVPRYLLCLPGSRMRRAPTPLLR